MNTKICTKCKKEKELDKFSFRLLRNNYRSQCQACLRDMGKTYYRKHKERHSVAVKNWKSFNMDKWVTYSRKYYTNNKKKIAERHQIRYRNKKEEILKKSKVRYRLNRKELLDYHKLYREKNKDKIKLRRHQNKTHKKTQDKIYYENNKQKIMTKHNEYRKKRFKIDKNYRLLYNIRRRIRNAIKNNQKSSSTISLLGCDIKSVKQHLESKWRPGMTWENWTYDGWHIDHIKPCSSFDLSNPDEQKKCFNYTNLQPLWATTDIARQNGDFESIGNLNKGNLIVV